MLEWKRVELRFQEGLRGSPRFSRNSSALRCSQKTAPTLRRVRHLLIQLPPSHILSFPLLLLLHLLQIIYIMQIIYNANKILQLKVSSCFQVVLTSMHKYIPRIWVIRCDDLASMNNLYSQPSASFTFDETEFIAVTAYQVSRKRTDY